MEHQRKVMRQQLMAEDKTATLTAKWKRMEQNLETTKARETELLLTFLSSRTDAQAEDIPAFMDAIEDHKTACNGEQARLKRANLRLELNTDRTRIDTTLTEEPYVKLLSEISQ